MRYKINLILFIIIFSWCGVAHSQDNIGYRVEILVFRLLDSLPEAESVLEPFDFSALLDLEERNLFRLEQLARMAGMNLVDAAELDLQPPLDPSAPQSDAWENIVWLDTRSEKMSSVWRNLRLSAEYRPQAFLAWEQSTEEPFPILRIHNEEVIRIDDSWSEMREVPDNDESGEPDWRAWRFIYDLESSEFGFAQLPRPKQYYQMDGSVRLRRSRFLHVDLDLRYRMPTAATVEGVSGPPLAREYQGYRAYTLKQSRQIRSERMEYFDSPLLGVLVWVTRIEAPEDGVEQ